MNHQSNSELAPATARPALRATKPLKVPPPHVYFIVSAVFHYLGPSFAVLLFARVQVLGVAWLRIASAGLIFAAWRRPWGVLQGLDRDGRRLLVAWGAVLAVMNCCFYEAINRLPLGTVAAIEFLPVIALAALGARTARNAVALLIAVPGVYLLTHVDLTAQPLGLAFAFANALLFATYIVLAHRVAQHPSVTGIDGLAVAMLIAAVVVTPLGGWQVVGVLKDPVALLAGIGVGVSSSVIPYVTDQLAMARLPRATYALMVSLLPATATVVGIVVLTQIPTVAETIGVGLVIAGVALHRDPGGESDGDHGEPGAGPADAGAGPADAGAGLANAGAGLADAHNRTLERSNSSSVRTGRCAQPHARSARGVQCAVMRAAPGSLTLAGRFTQPRAWSIVAPGPKPGGEA